MLLPIDQVEALFQCPVTGSSLERNGNSYLGGSTSTPTEYKVHNGAPVLVDFENSVISEPQDSEEIADASSPVERISKTGLRQLGSRIVSSDASVTTSNVKNLIELLANRGKPARLLVVGGGSIGKGISDLYNEYDIEIVSFDIYNSEVVQFVADAHQIPLKSDSFDAVVIQAVLEHVLYPEVVAKEIWRVLKTDGLVYAETPFMQQVHEGAYDFTRFTESGHRNLFRNFKLIKSGVVSGPGTVLMWSIDYFVSGLLRTRKAGKAIKLLFY